jgi:hypothetical protein
MPVDNEWVLLVECYTMAELHTVRATLEARGVPCQLHGEHTHGVLGPLQAGPMRSRVLVPRRALSLARSLVEDIVGPFDERPELDDDEGAEASPFRTSAELEPGDEPDGESDDDDEGSSSDDPDALAERRRPLPLRPRSYKVLMLIAFMGGAFLGLSHFYVRRTFIGGILATIAIFSLAAMARGAEWAELVLAVVWVFDIVGGLNGVYDDNRRLARLELAAEAQRPHT